MSISRQISPNYFNLTEEGLFIHYTEQNCECICRHLGWYRPSWHCNVKLAAHVQSELRNLTLPSSRQTKTKGGINFKVSPSFFRGWWVIREPSLEFTFSIALLVQCLSRLLKTGNSSCTWSSDLCVNPLLPICASPVVCLVHKIFVIRGWLMVYCCQRQNTPKPCCLFIWCLVIQLLTWSFGAILPRGECKIIWWNKKEI